MTDRPDLNPQSDHDLLVRVDQRLLDMSKNLQKLTGDNGWPGLCEQRAQQLVQIESRLAIVETDAAEVSKLRMRVGSLEDFRAWIKGGAWVFSFAHAAALAFVTWWLNTRKP